MKPLQIHFRSLAEIKTKRKDQRPKIHNKFIAKITNKNTVSQKIPGAILSLFLKNGLNQGVVR